MAFHWDPDLFVSPCGPWPLVLSSHNTQSVPVTAHCDTIVSFSERQLLVSCSVLSPLVVTGANGLFPVYITLNDTCWPKGEMNLRQGPWMCVDMRIVWDRRGTCLREAQRRCPLRVKACRDLQIVKSRDCGRNSLIFMFSFISLEHPNFRGECCLPEWWIPSSALLGTRCGRTMTECHLISCK